MTDNIEFDNTKKTNVDSELLQNDPKIDPKYDPNLDPETIAIREKIRKCKQKVEEAKLTKSKKSISKNKNIDKPLSAEWNFLFVFP